MLHISVAGFSGDYHMALEFPKLLGSTIATGLSLGSLALPHICKSQLPNPITPHVFKSNITYVTLLQSLAAGESYILTYERMEKPL